MKPQLSVLLAKGGEVDLSSHGCMPFLLLVRFGNVVETILGADVPKLKASVKQHAATIELA